MRSALPIGKRVLLVGHIAPHEPVGALVLQEDNGVVVPDGGLEQPLGVVRRGGRHDLEAGGAREERLDALGMVQRAPDAAAVGRPDDHRDAQLPVRSVPDLGGLADELVCGGPDEVGELDLGDRAHSVHRGAQRDAGDGRLGQGGVDHPLLPELLDEAVGGQEHAAPGADVLAHYEDPLVADHLLAHGVAHCLQDGLHRDGAPPEARSGEYTCSKKPSVSG